MALGNSFEIYFAFLARRSPNFKKTLTSEEIAPGKKLFSRNHSKKTMTEIKIYWRDMVVHLLQAATALFFLFAGWGLSSSSKFNICGNQEEKLAAYGLLICTAIYSILFPLAIIHIYKKFLSGKNDETVLPRNFSIISAFLLSLSALGIAILLSKIWL